MRTPMLILRNLRSQLGMAVDDNETVSYAEAEKAGLIADVVYLRKLGQIGIQPYHTWLKRLGENPNNYPSL